MNKKKMVSIILVSAGLGYLIFNIFTNRILLAESFSKFSISNILFVTLLLLPAYLINAISWHVITKFLKLGISLKSNIYIWVVSNLSRYLPGGIWQYPSRILLLSSNNVTKTTSTFAVFIESLLNLLVGLLIVFLASFLWKPIFELNQLLAFVIIILIILATLLVLFVLKKFIFKTMLIKLGAFTNISPIWIGPLFLLFFVQYLIPGSVLYLLVNNIEAMPISQLPIFVGIYTFSWMAGYITFFAPSGLGVQDVSIAALLSIFVPFPVAGAIAILLRAIMLVSEAMTILFVFYIMRRLK